MLLLSLSIVHSCDTAEKINPGIDTTRIVSLNGTLTEILCELGLEENLVGIDITSNYPVSVLQLPKAGYNRNINAEAVIAMNPSVIFAIEKSIKAETTEQFKSAGIPVVFFVQDYSIEGAKQLISRVADTLGLSSKAPAVIQKLEKDIAVIPRYPDKPGVLFIYARGSGSMSVGGKNTPVAKMIELAGGENAASDIEDYKPYTSESLVERNPDVLLLLESGLESLNGPEGLLQMPGVIQTNAGKNKKIITMDGHLLTGFSPRLGIAVSELSKLIHE